MIDFFGNILGIMHWWSISWGGDMHALVLTNCL